MIGLVGVVLVLGLALSCGQSPNTAANTPKTGKAGAAPTVQDITYADLKTKAQTVVEGFNKTREEAAAAMPAGRGIPAAQPPLSLFGVHFQLADTGTVVDTALQNGNHAMIDMDGDGKAEVNMDLGATAMPAKGDKVTFVAKINDVKMDGDKLMLTATSTQFKVAGGGA
jgi:hypothetical protein